MSTPRITASEAAAALGCTRQNVTHLIQAGRLDATRTEMGHLRVSLPSVMTYAGSGLRRRRRTKVAA